MSVNMAFSRAVSVTLLFLVASCAAKQNCSEVQCKLLPVSKDVASQFQLIKNSGEGVRMIYLKLKIGNDSYDPLHSPNEFLPYRWVWAATISEHLLSLSYEYNILSLGLLKRQVRGMDVQLEDEPEGCLAGLNSSCQDIVVARTLLANVTTSYGSGGIQSSEDVVCVAEIDKNINFYENLFEGNVEFRCCKVVDHQGGLNLIPECDLRVERSNWYKAFYIVLNILTFFVGFHALDLLLVLPDYIFDLRKECEREHQQEQEERLMQNGYLPIPSSQELPETTTKENINATDANAIGSEVVMLSHVRRQATFAEDHRDVIEEPNTTLPQSNEANVSEANVSGPNSNEPNLKEPNSDVSPNPRTNDKEDVEEEPEKRKIHEIPVDDGSPVNISTLLYACAKEFPHYSTKLSFNTKLAFLWFCVIPFFFYIESALSYILNDDYFDETGKKDTAFLTGGLFTVFDMTHTNKRGILIISYLFIPLLIILILRPKDLSEERTSPLSLVLDRVFQLKLDSTRSRVYIGDIGRYGLQKNRELLLKIISIGKVPIHVYQAVQSSCDPCKRTGARRSVRFFWVLLALISSSFAVICSVIMTAICLPLILFFSTIVLVGCSPYFLIVSLYLPFKLILRSSCWIRSFVFILSFGGFVELSFTQDRPLLYVINPFIWFVFTVTGPFHLSLFSCQFLIKLYGYTIMGLIYNAETAAPIAVFFATLATYLRDRYFDSKNKCKKVKEIISQEWQEQIKDLDNSGKLREKPKVTND